MKFSELVLIVYCWALFLICCGTTLSNNEDRKWLTALLDLIELDYEDKCEARAAEAWEELLGTPGALQRKVRKLRFVNS